MQADALPYRILQPLLKYGGGGKVRLNRIEYRKVNWRSLQPRFGFTVGNRMFQPEPQMKPDFSSFETHTARPLVNACCTRELRRQQRDRMVYDLGGMPFEVFPLLGQRDPVEIDHQPLARTGGEIRWLFAIRTRGSPHTSYGSSLRQGTSDHKLRRVGLQLAKLFIESRQVPHFHLLDVKVGGEPNGEKFKLPVSASANEFRCGCAGLKDR